MRCPKYPGLTDDALRPVTCAEEEAGPSQRFHPLCRSMTEPEGLASDDWVLQREDVDRFMRRYWHLFIPEEE